MTWYDPTYTAATELPALDLTHEHASVTHVRAEVSFYPIVTAECVLKDGQSTLSDCYLTVDTSVASPIGTSNMNSTEYDIPISSVSAGLHDISITNSGNTYTYFGPFKFYKSTDMDYLTMSLNSVSTSYDDHEQPADGGGTTYETDQPATIINLTVIGSREELNP